jgi:hypothetical protein
MQKIILKTNGYSEIHRRHPFPTISGLSVRSSGRLLSPDIIGIETNRKFFSCLTVITITFLLVSGCASSWKITRETSKSRYFSFTPPPKWMQFNQGSSVLLSCHGTTLDRISIIRRDITEPFPNTLLQVSPGMLPHELGEVIVARAIATPGVSNVFLQSMSPTYVDGISGVKCTFDYQINDLKFTEVVYSIIDYINIYEIRFCAAKRYYYNESLDVFESLVKSFRIQK